MLLLVLSLLSSVASSNNIRPYLGKNYVPLDTTNRLGAAFYFDNYCYNWKCWGTGEDSKAWIECYSISHRCSTTDRYVNGTWMAGAPVCTLMGEGYVTKDRLYCPERTNMTDGQEAYCRCYDNDRGEAKCGCTPIPSRGQFPLTYVLCPVAIVLLGLLYMAVRVLHERRRARAERRVPPYPSDPINPPGGMFDLRLENTLVIVSGLPDLPEYMEEGSKLPDYDEAEGPPPAYPGEGGTEWGEVAASQGLDVEQSNIVVENQSVESLDSESITQQNMMPPESDIEEGFSLVEASIDSKASTVFEESIESNSGILSDII